MNLSAFDLDDADDAFPASGSSVPLIASLADPREILQYMLASLTRAFPSDAGGPLDTTLAYLALQLTRFAARPFGMRALLIEPSGAGKTHLLELLTRLTGVPSVIIPMTDVAETSWSGTQIGDACRALHPDLFLHADGSGRPTVPRQLVDRPSIVCIDEIDTLSLTPVQGVRLDAAAAAWRIGRQQSILPLLDARSAMMVRADDPKASVRWSTARSLVLCSRASSMIPATRTVTPRALLDVGFMHELVDRLGLILHMPTPSLIALTARGQRAVKDTLALAAGVGVTVHGAPEFLSALSAPGATTPYVGPRGMTYFLEQHVLACVAAALAAGATETTMVPLRASTTP